MDFQSFEIIDKNFINCPSGSSQKSNCKIGPDSSDSMIEPTPSSLDSLDSVSSSEIKEKLNFLLQQTSDLKEKLKNKNEYVWHEIMQTKEKLSIKNSPEDSETAKQDDNNSKIVGSDDDSDYSIISPFENPTQNGESLLSVYGSELDVSTELAKEKQKCAYFVKLLKEEEEKNNVLRRICSKANQQEKKNIQLQLLVDSLQIDLSNAKSECEQLQKKEEEEKKQLHLKIDTLHDELIDALHKLKLKTENEELLKNSNEIDKVSINSMKGLEEFQLATSSHVEALETEVLMLQETYKNIEMDHIAQKKELDDVTHKLKLVSKEKEDMILLLTKLKVENENLNDNINVLKQRHQEEIDQLTAKILDLEQLNTALQNKPGIRSTDDYIVGASAPPNEHFTENVSSADNCPPGFTCPQCFAVYQTSFEQFESHVYECVESNI